MMIYTDNTNLLMPALIELPIMSVVHPAYHCLPNGGHGSFFPSASLRLSCVRVFATVYRFLVSCASEVCRNWSRVHSAGYVTAMKTVSTHVLYLIRYYQPISTAPAVEPAIMERKALGYDHG